LLPEKRVHRAIRPPARHESSAHCWAKRSGHDRSVGHQNRPTDSLPCGLLSPTFGRTRWYRLRIGWHRFPVSFDPIYQESGEAPLRSCQASFPFVLLLRIGSGRQRHEVGLQIDLPALDTQFGPNMFSMGIDGFFRQIHHVRNFFGPFPFSHQVGNL
jgi:hypothetical protein